MEKLELFTFGKWIDPVVEEVRTVREKLWKEFNYDLDRFCAKLREKQGSHGLQVVTKIDLSDERKYSVDRVSF